MEQEREKKKEELERTTQDDWKAEEFEIQKIRDNNLISEFGCTTMSIDNVVSDYVTSERGFRAKRNHRHRVQAAEIIQRVWRASGRSRAASKPDTKGTDASSARRKDDRRDTDGPKRVVTRRWEMFGSFLLGQNTVHQYDRRIFAQDRPHSVRISSPAVKYALNGAQIDVEGPGKYNVYVGVND